MVSKYRIVGLDANLQVAWMRSHQRADDSKNKSNSKRCWEYSEKRQETWFQTCPCRQGLLLTERPEIPSEVLKVIGKEVERIIAGWEGR